MLPNQAFIWQTDASKMDAAWANQVITYRRRYWQPVVDKTTYAVNKAYILSVQSMEDVKKYFDDAEFVRNIQFRPLPFFEKPRNILNDEIKKSGIKPYLIAEDPTAEQDKEDDKFLLQNRKVLQGAVNTNRKKLGLAPFLVNKDNYNGNVDDFDKMGLNDQDPADVGFFFDNFYKLNYVARAQTMVNSYMDINKVNDDVTRFVNDILAVKCVCKQDYISPLTGEIRSKYLQPSQTYAIFGNNRDATDASVRGWERQITVEELLNQLGNAFDFEKDWVFLVQSINYGSSQVFDGFIRNGINYAITSSTLNASLSGLQAPIDNERPLNLLNWENAFNYKVYFGYIEWEQLCEERTKVNRNTGQRFQTDFEFKPTERSLYDVESKYYFKTITSNYMPVGLEQQKLFGYGDLYHQLTEGQYDEYSRGSISIIREEGLGAADVAKPYIDLGNFAYYRMLWAIHRSKPDVWSWSFESIRDVAMKMFPTTQAVQGVQGNAPQVAGAFGSAVDNLIDKFQKKLFMLHTYPIVDGQVIGGGGMPHYKIPGALDALAIQLREVVLDWAEYQITDKLGLSGIAGGEAPNPKDGLKLAQEFLKKSRSATGYIPDMIENTFEHTAKLILLYTQDIIKHKASIPYKYLLNLAGQKAIDCINDLGDIAAHRLGIVVNSFDTTSTNEQIDAQASQAQMQGQITFGQYLLVTQIKEPRLKAITFAYYEEKAKKDQQQNLMQLEGQKQQTIQMQHNNDMELADRKGNWDVQVADKQAQAQVAGKQIEYKGKVDAKALQINSEPAKQSAKVEGEKQIIETKNNVEQQQAFT